MASKATAVAVPPQSIADIPGVGGVAGQVPAAETSAGVPAQTDYKPAPLTARQKLEKQIQDAKARIEKDTAFLNDAVPRLQSIDSLDSIKTGTGVTIRIGRAETTRNVSGVVTGVDTSGAAPRYKVFYGEGFDAETVVVLQSQIISVVPNAA